MMEAEAHRKSTRRVRGWKYTEYLAWIKENKMHHPLAKQPSTAHMDVLLLWMSSEYLCGGEEQSLSAARLLQGQRVGSRQDG